VLGHPRQQLLPVLIAERQNHIVASQPETFPFRRAFDGCGQFRLAVSQRPEFALGPHPTQFVMDKHGSRGPGQARGHSGILDKFHLHQVALQFSGQPDDVRGPTRIQFRGLRPELSGATGVFARQIAFHTAARAPGQHREYSGPCVPACVIGIRRGPRLSETDET